MCANDHALVPEKSRTHEGHLRQHRLEQWTQVGLHTQTQNTGVDRQGRKRLQVRSGQVLKTVGIMANVGTGLDNGRQGLRHRRQQCSQTVQQHHNVTELFQTTQHTLRDVLGTDQ